MKLSIKRTKNNTFFYMVKSIRINGKSTSRIIECLGKLEEVKVKANGEVIKATILMVTHDAFTASYADRIIFIKDGKIFNELINLQKSFLKAFNKTLKNIENKKEKLEKCCVYAIF